VEELGRTVPAAGSKEADTLSAQASATRSSVSAAARDHKTAIGILSLAMELFALRRKLRALDDNLRQTEALAGAAKNLRAPLVARIRELTQQGDELAGRPDSADPAVLAQESKELDALTMQFKQLSASLLPLEKQAILLDVYKRSIINWSNDVES